MNKGIVYQVCFKEECSDLSLCQAEFCVRRDIRFSYYIIF